MTSDSPVQSRSLPSRVLRQYGLVKSGNQPGFAAGTALQKCVGKLVHGAGAAAGKHKFCIIFCGGLNDTNRQIRPTRP